MAEVFFPEAVANFVQSLEPHFTDVLADLLAISKEGPERFDFCQDHGKGLWEYRRPLGGARYAYLLFAFEESCDSYIVLHGFRGGPTGPTRSDLREARRTWTARLRD
jgi:hypothetical protein